MRKIVYHSDFADQLVDAEIEFPRIEEFLAGLKSKLRRNPEFGVRVRDNPPIWFVAVPDLFEVSIGLTYPSTTRPSCCCPSGSIRLDDWRV